MRNGIIAFVATVVLLAAGWWFFLRESSQDPAGADISTQRTQQQDSQASDDQTVGGQGASIGEENLVEFRCDGGKKITAVFTRDIVGLTLSDGRQVELRQVDETRYVNVNGTIEFHGRGEGAALIEGSRTTYANCVAMI